MITLRNALICCIALLLAACGSRMSDEDYYVITEEFTDEIVFNILETEDLEFDSEYEKYVEDKLEEVAQRYEYTANDYLSEARSRGEGWDTIWERIGERIVEFLELIWDEMDEEELEKEFD